MQITVIKLVLDAGYVVKAVLLLLLMFSTVSWAIIIYKNRYFARARRETADFMAALNSGTDMKGLFSLARKQAIGPVSNVFKAVYPDSPRFDGRELRRAIKRYGLLEASKLESRLSFLATTGSTTPFIGLFGTVWGIMNSFRGIGAAGTASLSVVAPGIAEALIATAMGLLAAIPAVIAYNYYLSRARKAVTELEALSEDLIELLTKHQPDPARDSDPS